MGHKENQRDNVVYIGKRLVIVLILVSLLTAALLFENEVVNAPFPKPMLIWNSLSTRSNTSYNGLTMKRNDQSWFSSTLRNTTNRQEDQPFDYLSTTQWGKQNQTAWKLIYGDLNCPDNSKRKAMNAILTTWLELTKKYDIDFAFVYGSLIGVVRNNDIVPWDHDIDVYVEYNDLLKLESVGWPRDIHVEKNKTIVNYIPNSEHKKPANERIRWDCHGKASPGAGDQCSIQEPLVRLYNNGAFLDVLDYHIKTDTIEMFSEGRVFITKKSHYFPLRRCIFMGFHGWCPNDPAGMLSSYYGPYFLTPNKRCKDGRWVKVKKRTS